MHRFTLGEVILLWGMLIGYGVVMVTGAGALVMVPLWSFGVLTPPSWATALWHNTFFRYSLFTLGSGWTLRFITRRIRRSQAK
jgi:hypothetical protein